MMIHKIIERIQNIQDLEYFWSLPPSNFLQRIIQFLDTVDPRFRGFLETYGDPATVKVSLIDAPHIRFCLKSGDFNGEAFVPKISIWTSSHCVIVTVDAEIPSLSMKKQLTLFWRVGNTPGVNVPEFYTDSQGNQKAGDFPDLLMSFYGRWRPKYETERP